MKILFTSDIHASDSHLNSMISTAEKEEVDCVIIGGDIIPHYLDESAELGVIKAHARYLENTFFPAVKDFKNRSDIPIYLDLGNDDFMYNRKILEQYNGDLFYLIHFAKHGLTEDVDIIGYMNVPPTPFKLKDWEKPDSADNPYIFGNRISINGFITANGTIEDVALEMGSDDTIEKDMNRLSEMVDRQFIFVSHSPPYQSQLDVIHNGQNVGSISIRKFIEKWSEKGLLVASFHGHIHESPERSGSISTKIGNSLCVNPGQGNGKGAPFRYVIFHLDESRVLICGP